MKNIWLEDRYIHIDGTFYNFKPWQLETYHSPMIGTTMVLVLCKPSRELVDAVDRAVRDEKHRKPLDRAKVCTIRCPEISDRKILATITDYRYNRYITIRNTLEMKWWVVL